MPFGVSEGMVSDGSMPLKVLVREEETVRTSQVRVFTTVAPMVVFRAISSVAIIVVLEGTA